MDYNKLIINTTNKYHQNPEGSHRELHQLTPEKLQNITSIESLLTYYITISVELSVLTIMLNNEQNVPLNTANNIIDKFLDIKSMIAERMSDLLKEDNKDYVYDDYSHCPIIDLITLIGMINPTRIIRYYLSWIAIFEFDITNNIDQGKDLINSYQYKQILKFLDEIIIQGCKTDESTARCLSNEKTSLMIYVTKELCQDEIISAYNKLQKEINTKKKIQEYAEDEDKIIYN